MLVNTIIRYFGCEFLKDISSFFNFKLLWTRLQNIQNKMFVCKKKKKKDALSLWKFLKLTSGWSSIYFPEITSHHYHSGEETNSRGPASAPLMPNPALLKLARQWCRGGPGQQGKQFLIIIVITRRPYHHGCLSSDVLRWLSARLVLSPREQVNASTLSGLSSLRLFSHLHICRVSPRPPNPQSQQPPYSLVSLAKHKAGDYYRGPRSAAWKIKARCDGSLSDNCWWLNIPFYFYDANICLWWHTLRCDSSFIIHEEARGLLCGLQCVCVYVCVWEKRVSS